MLIENDEEQTWILAGVPSTETPTAAIFKVQEEALEVALEISRLESGRSSWETIAEELGHLIVALHGLAFIDPLLVEAADRSMEAKFQELRALLDPEGSRAE